MGFVRVFPAKDFLDCFSESAFSFCAVFLCFGGTEVVVLLVGFESDFLFLLSDSAMLEPGES